MPLSWNEIRARAIAFSKDWAHVGSERRIGISNGLLSTRRNVLEILKLTTIAFDTACNGVPGYSPIYPVLKPLLP